MLPLGGPQPAVTARTGLTEAADDVRDLTGVGVSPVAKSLPGEEVSTTNRAERHGLIVGPGPDGADKYAFEVVS